MAGNNSGHLVGTPPESDLRSGTKTRVRAYAWAVFATASGVVVVLAASGAPLPGVVPVVALGALIAISVNQYALFPSEWSATAEDAVLVVAVVGFAGTAHGADLLGPAAVGFLCGPLDVVHWQERAAWRMAYNSGTRMIAALVGATVFGALRGPSLAFGTHLVVASVTVAFAFALVDLVLFVAFEKLRGEQSMRAAAREDLLIDCLTVPLCLVGAAAGWVAVEEAWWAGALVLLPAVFAPELVLVRGRNVVRMSGAVARARAALPVLLVGAAVVAAVVALAPLPATAVVLTLGVLAVVTGFELPGDARAPVPASGLAALVGAAMVAGGHAALATAVVVAVVTTATVWVCLRCNVWWASMVAAGAAAVSAVVFAAHPSRVGALGAALVFELLLLTRLPRILWTTPLVCTAVALANVWRETGRARGIAAFAAGLLTVTALAALWGAPPWGSRMLGPWGARHPMRAHRVTVFAATVMSLALALAAAAMSSETREPLVLGASAVAAALATMAMVGVRQWRFAPRPRARAAAGVLTSALLAVTVYPTVASASRWWSIAILAAALAMCGTIAWRVARLADVAARRVETRAGEIAVP